LTLAAQFSENLLVLSHGRAVASGAPADVLTEVNIRRFFGAEVEVLHSGSGLSVTPIRRRVPLLTAAVANLSANDRHLNGI
jgi:iron complex transport system ATP-binding protein